MNIFSTSTSAYENPLLMAALFICGILIIFLMIAVPSKKNKAPMHYFVRKTELPSDDHHERAANYIWLGIIAAIIIYYFI